MIFLKFRKVYEHVSFSVLQASDMEMENQNCSVNGYDGDLLFGGGRWGLRSVISKMAA